MSGIVGYVGNGDAVEIILEELCKLEYRGYDSSGIAVMQDGKIQIEKRMGRLTNLRDCLARNPIKGSVGIGHTRWATHGAPSDINAHPHYSNDKSVAVVHNGIIENYIPLKKQLETQGCHFISQTDTEVIAHLFYVLYDGDMISTLRKVLRKIEGTYSFEIIHKDHPNEILCARKDSPLVIGIGENQNFIASDAPALVKYTKNVYYLENGDYAKVEKNKITIFDENDKEVTRDKHELKWTLEQASKGGYPHFMIKEIYEQPFALEETLKRRVDCRDYSINFHDVLSEDEILNIEDIRIIASGTSYNAGLQGAYALETLAKIRAKAVIASENRHSNYFTGKNTLVIILSQSGETMDTLLAMRECKEKGAKILTISNVVDSSIPRESDKVIYTTAGPEIAVASTKSYTNQVLVLYLLAIYMADVKKVIDFNTKKMLLDELREIPEKIKIVLEKEEEIENIARKIYETASGFYIGRGLNYMVALEGALKMKEVAYIHTDALPSGELKHGPLSLAEKGIIAVIVSAQKEIMNKAIAAMKELKARDVTIIVVAQEFSYEALKDVADEIILIPDCKDMLSGMISVVPLQLLAYHTAVLKGVDVDKPRNIAKSVTVE